VLRKRKYFKLLYYTAKLSHYHSFVAINPDTPLTNLLQYSAPEYLRNQWILT